MTSRFVGVIVIALLAMATSHAVAEETLESAQKIVDETITNAGAIPKQADALARLAWPAEDGDANVMLLARKALMAYGEYAIPSLRKAVTSVRPDQQEEVVWALMRAFLQIDTGLPSEYLIGLEEATWFGTREARLRAIPELGRHRYRPSMLTIIDAAYDDPELMPTVIESLGMMRDTRARFFLEKVMLEGAPEVRGQAAAALARLGGTALYPLKLAMRSDDPEVRLVAVQALLPVATVDDISTLHEYAYNHPDDDPGILEAVRASALMLEEALARQAEAESASAESDTE